MRPQDIQKLLSLGEGQRIEFKADYRDGASVGSVVCGLLNSLGGYVVCGVSPEGEILGVDTSPDQVATFEKQLHEGLSPKALVSVQVRKLEEKPLVVIEVPAGQDGPYAFRNTIYIREGESTREADAETIRDFIQRRQVEPER